MRTPPTASPRRRRLASLGVGLLASLLAVVATTLTAPAAQAATIDCPNQSSVSCKDTVPVADCAWNNGDGTTSFVWGWDNPGADTAHAVAGSAQNRMTPAVTPTQPELFAPGRHMNAFWVTVSGTTSTWRLGNTTVTATSGPGGDTAGCATKPVSQVGSVGALALFVLMAALAALLVVAVRSRRHPAGVR